MTPPHRAGEDWNRVPSTDPVDGASDHADIPAAYRDAASMPAAAEARRKSVLWRLVDAAVFVGVAGMLVMVTIQVLSRLHLQSVPWTEEVTRYLFIWTTFLGLAAGFRSVEHTRITLLVMVLPGRLRTLAVHAYFLAGVVFFGIVAYTGWNLVAQQFVSGESSPALGLGMFLVTSAVVAGAVLSIWALVESIYLDPATRKLLD